ncbi:MAG: hypothetical protein CMO55_02420 [Verrucomicrobiales bacterium]|nr:hypothetical protein [Verrucomicrobiales bacterium]
MHDPPWLERTRGYIDLGMLEEADREIEKLPPDRRGTPQVQEMRIIIALDRGHLEDALTLSEVLCEVHPEEHAGYIQGAYALHALSRTQDAIDHLQKGPASLQDEPVYFYNLACYELALGREQAALTWLSQSIDMEPSFRQKALDDPDLGPLKKEIK